MLIAGGMQGDGSARRGHGTSVTIISILFFILHLLIQIGVIKMFLKLLDGGSAHLKELISHGNLFIRYLVAYVLCMIGLVVGTILFIVPGVWFLLTYMFVPIIAVDTHLGIKASFKESARMTKGVRWKLLGLIACMALLNILGALALVVGLLVTVPVSWLAYFEVYRTLKARS